MALVLRDRRLVGELTDRELREFERQNLLAVIERNGWRLQGERGAARALGLSPSTLRDRMKSFGIRRPR
jgi:transcriptional regulator with GAF, ATPase, and Fis domain